MLLDTVSYVSLFFFLYVLLGFFLFVCFSFVFGFLFVCFYFIFFFFAINNNSKGFCQSLLDIWWLLQSLQRYRSPQRHLYKLRISKQDLWQITNFTPLLVNLKQVFASYAKTFQYKTFSDFHFIGICKVSTQINKCPQEFFQHLLTNILLIIQLSIKQF